MRLALARGAAAERLAAAFVLAWCVCQGPAGLDGGESPGVAGAVLAVSDGEPFKALATT